ncbi:MAG TPA: HAD family hydrolase [Alphaproteobacteria bacterium]|jgi:HAD superfamily hydrolase (TIGR01509 family)|nr:HAD family hydrolase [Alphaproteobacteria bacterium]MDP7428962.1 HAD family hydrolase [Alphaproteobacteria bacterium]HJM51547.1 HAD family hydrolase [Alphaproteobacteria bacterium]
MPPAKTELVIFDCDGVLVDSEPIANRTLAAALVAQGLEISEAEVTRVTTGLSLTSVLDWLAADFGLRLGDGFLAALQDVTFAAFRNDLQALPGAPGAVAAIQQSGLLSCVASSGEIAKMTLTLTLTGLYEAFAGRLFSATWVAAGKPAPDVFLYAAREMGVAPERCLVVEDSLPGIAAARAAGMTVLGYGGDDLAAAGAKTFADMSELPELISNVIGQPEAGPGR